MKHPLALPLVLTFCLMVLLGASLNIWRWSQVSGSLSQQTLPPAPLVITPGVPTGLIGVVSVLGTSTVTIVGKSPGVADELTLMVMVDETTTITKISPAPDYATSTAMFSDFKIGMLLNISATAEQGGVRYAQRILIPTVQ